MKPLTPEQRDWNFTKQQSREITRELARLLDEVGKGNIFPYRLGEDLLDGMRKWANANTTEDEEIKGAKIWEKKCFVSILYARGSITEEQREEIYKWLDAGYPDLDEQEVEIVMRQNQKYDPSSELPQSLGLENDYLENEPANTTEDEPIAGVTFGDGEFVPIEDESIMQWIAEQLQQEDSE